MGGDGVGAGKQTQTMLFLELDLVVLLCKNPREVRTASVKARNNEFLCKTQLGATPTFFTHSLN